jgi:alkyldihydroxyacetonephosphate synthase
MASSENDTSFARDTVRKVYALVRAGYKRCVDVVRAISAGLPGITLSDSTPDKLAYSRDLWPRRLLDVRRGRAGQHQPALVVWPRNADDVVTLVRLARHEGFSLVPFGAGSGVCGGIEPAPDTVVVDLKLMRDWTIDRDRPLIDVGPGAAGSTLEEDVQRAGFTIGHFPSSILCSTPGGWIAARGAGQCSGLYGKIEDMVVSLECVLGTGELVELERRFDGPNMIPFVVGSEGTLGIVTRAKLRLHPAPASRSFTAFSFADIRAGWDAMRTLFQAGLRPAVSRLYDPIDSTIMKQGSVRSGAAKPKRAPGARRGRGRSLLGPLFRGVLRAPRALNAAIEAAEGNLLGGCTLVLVFEGQGDDVHADRERADVLCRLAGGQSLGEGPARKWFAHRYSVSYRQAPVFRMGAFSDTMEVAAPWSKLGALYDGVREALGEHVLVMAHLSHAYPDGCSIYFTFSGAADDDDRAIALYESAWRDALAAAIDAGGTLSHHHGVGRSKAPKLGAELGHGVTLVRRLMRAWDPDGRLNPGNLLPREESRPPEAPRVFEPFVPGRVDEASLLATFAGERTLDEAERELSRRNLTLGLSGDAPLSEPLADWIARGMPGAPDPWLDPVAQTLSGFVARTNDGAELAVRPAPRRAVGPDLSALFVGAAERVGRIEQATLRVERRGAPRARSLPFAGERNPALSPSEAAAWERIVSAVAQTE